MHLERFAFTRKALIRTLTQIALSIFGGLLVNAIGPILFVKLLQNIISIEQSNIILGIFFPLLGYLIIVGGFLYIVAAYFDRLWPLLEPSNEHPRVLSLPGIRLEILSQEINSARQRIQAEPEKAKPAWDLARVKLELYYDRNLSQINLIFWVSVVVMMVGFGFILFGISQAFTSSKLAQDANSNTITPVVVGTVSGVITEFIGATFLFLYRSTVQQAIAYTRSLERINSVGMAMQILDTISGETNELQDKTKAELVKLLLIQSSNFTEKGSSEQK